MSTIRSREREFDLPSIMGRWFEIARLPTRFLFNDDIVNITFEFYQEEPNSFRIIVNGFDVEKALKPITYEGRAIAENEVDNLREYRTYFPELHRCCINGEEPNFRIIKYTPSDGALLIGSPSKQYLWFLSRYPRMDRGVFLTLCRAAVEAGYDMMPQVPRDPQTFMEAYRLVRYGTGPYPPRLNAYGVMDADEEFNTYFERVHVTRHVRFRSRLKRFYRFKSKDTDEQEDHSNVNYLNEQGGRPLFYGDDSDANGQPYDTFILQPRIPQQEEEYE